MSMKQVNMMHILLLGPSLIYIGNLNNNNLSNLNNYFIDYIFNSLIGYSLMIPFIVRNKFIKKNIKNFNYRNWINLSHYILFMWIFLYIGIQGRNISNLLRKISLIIGISMISIHIYYLFHEHNHYFLQ